MLGQYLQALSGTIGPCLLVMCMNVLLTVGEGREKPASHRWRSIGLMVGLVASVVFAILRGTAVINRRSTVNLPTLIGCVIFDVLMIIVVVRARSLTRNWQLSRAAATGHALPAASFVGFADDSFGVVTGDAANASGTTDSANATTNAPTGATTGKGVAGRTARIPDTKATELRMNIANAIAAVGIALTTFYAVPDVILQLTNFVDTGDSPFTSDMLLRALGMLLGVGTAIVAAAIFRTMRSTSVRWAFTLAAALGLVLQLLTHLAELFSLLMNMMILVLSGTPFRILIFFHNRELEMTYGQMLLFIIPAIASIIIGFRTAKTGPTDAAVRSRIAFRRRAKAAGAWSLIAVIAVVTSLAWGTYEENKEPVVSEPEEYSLVDGVATISFTQVSDGHLHRFEYTASDGTVMRFIIIQKNGGAYGIGLDACETCGDAGYYEEDGKIICKRCDVAINLATIGFKGGCNPIPVDYEIGDGVIIIQASDLDALSAHFQ